MNASLLPPQVESLEAAKRKIDEMAAQGKLDPALLLTMAKAYAGAKGTAITKEEVRPAAPLSLAFTHLSSFFCYIGKGAYY